VTLAIVPTYLTTAEDVAVAHKALQGLLATPELDVLVVDDCSPAIELVGVLKKLSERLGFGLVEQLSNEGFAATVNVGLRRALKTGQDAVLVNADIELPDPRWLERLLATPVPGQEGLASVAGGLLTYPSGLIQFAGTYFSLLTRGFDHAYRYGPANLREAQGLRVTPITGALQLIRHECLEAVGLYDEGYRMGYEDVDYCLRVFTSGRWCVFNSKVRAVHHESLFRGRRNERLDRWQRESYVRLSEKWAEQSFAGFVPQL
jgi:GT2 family glycosyltransferase